MKAKRILATILSVALVVTSGNFTLDVSATWDGGDTPVVGTEQTDPGSDEESSGENLGDGSDAADADSAETGEAGADQALAAEGGSQGGDDLIVAWNDYFAVTESGKLCEKEGTPISGLRGTVALPKEAKRIPAGIFSNNTNITALTIPADSLLEAIDEGAFKGSGITAISLPDAVTEIKKETFKNSALRSIEFRSTSRLVSVGEEAFLGCKLTTMEFPVTVVRVEESAFRDCTELNSITLHNVEQLGNHVFRNSAKLTSIGWGEKLTKIGNYAFAGTGVSRTLDLSKAFANVSQDGWGSSVFEGCAALTAVKLPAGMTLIPEAMFKNCTSLATIDIPVGCKVIKREAFFGCAVKKVTVPANVDAIESGAFADCQSLTEVTVNQRGSANGDSSIKLAEDAFNQKKLTMKGYDGTVEDYATEKGYTFTTLYASHAVTVKVNNSDYGKATLSAKKAREGDIIEVTVTPASADYRLRSYGFKYNDELVTNLKEEKAGSQVFSFVMPDEDVEVYVPFERVALAYASLRKDFEQTDTQMSYSWDGKKLIFDKTGMSCRLVVEGKRGSSWYEISTWALDFSSSKSSVVSVNEQGVLYARGKGTAKITATLKEDNTKSVSFNVTVEEEAVIDYDNIQISFADLEKAKETTETIPEEGGNKVYKVIQYTKSQLSKEEQWFTVNLKATEFLDSANLNVISEWKSANEEFAYVDNASVNNNTNVIRVKQGVVGETSVTVSVTNGKTGKNKKIEYEESIIIRVIDVTPRLLQSTLTVNSNCDVNSGMEFDLLSVYGYEVDLSSLSVDLLVSGSKTRDYEPLDTVLIGLSNGRPYIELSPEGRTLLANKSSKTYTNAYIRGEYTYLSDSGAAVTEEFHTPIKSLVLTKKALKPTVKLSGKINLFFNAAADVEDKGEVKITQSLKTLNVANYRLVSEANYKLANSETPDPFANNFDVSADGVITRSANEELMTDAKGKVVTKGYLEITYEGYAPVYVKITVPTKNTKPAYVLSKTKATVNANSRGYAVGLQILEKKSKKPISLAHLTELSFNQSSSGTTMGLFEELDAADARLTDTITLKINDASKGKAIINVEMDTWNEPMKFTFNLSVNSKAPSAKLKKTTLTLNNLCVGKEESTTVSLNQADVEILSMDQIEFAGKDALAYDAQKILPNIIYSAEDKTLTVSASDTVQAGSYKFRMTPHVQYTNGQTADLKSVTVTVKVIGKQLTATLKPTSVTLNNKFVGRETAVTSYTIKNMPAGNGAITIQSQDVTISGVNASAQDMKNAFDFTFDSDAAKIRVSQLQTVGKTGSYKYEIAGLKVVIGGAAVEIQPFKITVKVINKAATVTAKASGNINPISGSGIVYTLKTGNTSAQITDVTVKELNKVNGKYNMVDLENFQIGEIQRNEDDGIVSVQILANDNKNVANGTHKLRIGIKLEGAAPEESEIAWTKDLSVKPKQTLPKVKADVTSATMYAGVSIDSPKRSQQIRLTKTTEKSAVMNNVVLADSNSENIKKALRVTAFDRDTQTATVTLIRPDLLVADTEYTVKLEARYEKQMTKTKGSAFTLKLKVLN
ncbi:MAG: leucine-rich repeat domain-containing protein [Muribaculum sp.]|nr:leucine-rich repeat domain-containing protein [Muribaculum sp.]